MPCSSAYAVAAVVALLCLSGPERSDAQVARSGSGAGANAQAVQQLQQLASERTSLQAQNAKLQQQLDALTKERDALKTSQQTLEKRAQTSESQVRTLQASASRSADAERELTQTKEKMQQLVGKFRELAQNMRQVEADSIANKQTLSLRERDLKTCIDHNQGLYSLNQEVLNRLEHPRSSASPVESFVKIKQVQLENMVDDYKSRADDLKVKPPTPPLPASPPATSAYPAPADTAIPDGAPAR